MSAVKEEPLKGHSSGSVSIVASNHKHTRSNSSISNGGDSKVIPKRHSSKLLSNLQDDGLLDRRNQVTSAMSKAVRQGLSAEENNEADERMINQFLRATKLDVDKAIKRLKATIAWRLKEEPHRRICQLCNNSPRSHYLNLVGFTKLGQPVIYSCFAMAKDRTLSATREHMLTTFEQAIRLMPPGVEQWIWIADYHGFGIKDCDPRLAKIFLEVSERHYPERLASFINVSTPSIFPMFFKAFENYIDPYTRGKIKFLNFGSKNSKHSQQFREELGRILDPEMLDWICTEMAQNRTKAGVKTKEYPYGHRFLEVGSHKNVVYEGHDCRGQKDFLAAVQATPNALVPPGL